MVTTDGVATANRERDPDLREQVGVPARAAGVELLGELDGSGFEQPPCLVRRGDGQTVQLTELLYRTLESIDGERDLDDVAAALTARIGKRASADDVRFLVDEKLRPLGLLRQPDGSQPEVARSNPLLALRFRVAISDERTTRRVTAPFAALFWPPIVVAVVAGFAVMTVWLLGVHGVASGTRAMLYEPAMLVLLFGLTIASAGFHELGHAAACQYGGAKPGVMGAGLYLVWPAFYTDVTDSYRLGRRGRLRTDLGGLYFNMVFALATFGVWAITGVEALLVVIPLQLLQMVHQLLPFVRLDGYLILSDLTGVPDLFARIKPTLRSALPWSRPDERVSALKPWVRVVVTAWVVMVVPVLLFGLAVVALGLPRLAATAWDSAGRQVDAIGAADGDTWAVVASVFAIAALALPALSTAYLLARIGRAALASRAGRVGLAAAAAGAAWLWWPNGEYEPIHREERGTVLDTVRAVRAIPSGRPGLTEAREAELVEPGSTTTASTTASTSTSTSTSTTTTTTTTTVDDGAVRTTTTGEPEATPSTLGTTSTSTPTTTSTSTSTTSTSTSTSTTEETAP